MNIILSNGMTLPAMGFGTYKIPDGDPVRHAVHEALKSGYTFIDTASFYKNEEGIGSVMGTLSESEQPLVQTKVWNSEQGYRPTHEAFERSLEKLEIIDSYLIHWAVPGLFLETWQAMEELYTAQKVAIIGVCNFSIHHIEEIFRAGLMLPLINQIEIHPRLCQDELVKYCQDRGILVQAWRPLMNGQVGDILEMQEIARRHNKSPEQVALRWLIQRGIMPLVKSVTPNRIAGNIEVFDFYLSDHEMDRIFSLNSGERMGPDPDNVNF